MKQLHAAARGAASRPASAPGSRPVADLPAWLEAWSEGRLCDEEEMAALEARGLDVLPELQRLLVRFPAGDANRTALTALARRLGNVIREVTFVTYEEDELTLPPELHATTRSASGTTTTAEQLLGLLLTAARSLPSHRGVVSLEADRTGDGTGVMVVIRLRKEDGAGDWGGVGFTIHAAEQEVADGHESGKRTLFDDPDDFRELRVAMAKALATEPTERLVISVDLRWQ